MRLDVSELRDQLGKRLEVPVSVEPGPAEADGDLLGFPGPFAGKVEAISTDNGVVVRFRLKGEAELQCARCLTPYRLPLRLDFTEEFRPGRPTPAVGDFAEDAEGATFVPFQGDVIELDEVLRQRILLELPMKPLCRDDCLGLCPTCGHNRNLGPCQCQPETGGTGLDALRVILDRPEPEG